MFTIRHIDHVALTVSDVERSVAWYQEVLGLERRYQEAWGSCPAVMCAAETSVALFPSAAGPPLPSPDPRATLAMRHLAFRVDRENFARARQALGKRGIQFRFEDHEISHSIYFHDPDGYVIEITTYDLGSPPPTPPAPPAE